jgi:outer membrane protein assembly factor BamB
MMGLWRAFSSSPPSSSQRAQDWSQWRGPSRDGALPPISGPKQSPASFTSAWRADVGEGYSSPVVANGRVFVHSRRDPQEIVTGLDLNTGKVLWQQSYAGEYKKNQYAACMGKGPNATPLVAGSRLFTLGAPQRKKGRPVPGPPPKPYPLTR